MSSGSSYLGAPLIGGGPDHRLDLLYYLLKFLLQNSIESHCKEDLSPNALRTCPPSPEAPREYLCR
jgi:hypothetical protein